MAEIQTALVEGISPGLLLNVFVLMVAYTLWEAFRERVRRELRYRRVKSMSLGFKSLIIYDGVTYTIGNVDRYSVTLNGVDDEPYQFIPLERWINMVKTVPKR